jgi:hypothetical protein
MYEELSEAPPGPYETLIPFSVSFAIDPPCVNESHLMVIRRRPSLICLSRCTLYCRLLLPYRVFHRSLSRSHAADSAGIRGPIRYGINLVQYIITIPRSSPSALTVRIKEALTSRR